MKSRPHAPGWTRVFLWSFLFVSYIPLLFLVKNSLVQDGEFSLYWYGLLLQDQNLLEPALRSFQIALLNGFVSTCIGLCAAISLHKKSQKFKKLLNFFIGTSLALPELVMALSLMSWFFMIGMPLSLFTVLISHVTFSLSFVVFIIGARLTQMDTSLEEAGEDLGGSAFEVFLKVTLPQLKPAVLLSFSICFLLSFDDFLITFFVSGVGSDTLPLRLYQMLKQGTSPKLSALATLILMLPVLLAILMNLKKIRFSLKRTGLN